jgi:hypothetical protein
MRSKLPLVLVAILGALASTLGACVQPPPAIQAANARESKLAVYVNPQAQLQGDQMDELQGMATSVPNAVTSALTKAGYTVVTDPNAPHDVTCNLVITITKGQNVMTNFATGQQVQPAQANVHMTLVGSGSALIDDLQVTTQGGNPSVPTELDRIGNTLANEMDQSQRLMAYAQKNGAGGGTQVASGGADNGSGGASGNTSTAGTSGGGGSAPNVDAPMISGAAQRNAYALVIGIEHYRDVPGPPGARADAQAFAALAKSSLGVPDANVQTAFDDHAAMSDIDKQLQWLKGNVQQGGRIYFYFSGHGAPDATNGTPYLLPYDGDPKYVKETAVPLAKVLQGLTSTQAQNVFVFVDSCFSGEGGRSVLPKGVRPLVRVHQEAPVAKLAVMTASGGDEISGNLPGQDRGLFTSFVLDGVGHAKADANSDGQVSLGELYAYVKPNVAQLAKRDNRDQNPALTLGADVGDPQALMVATGLHP